MFNSLKKLLPAIVLLFSLLTPTTASAVTVNFNCGTSGTYQVDNVTKTLTGLTDCVGVVDIDSSVTIIGLRAFERNNENLTSIIIPSSVTTIEGLAFAGTSSVIFRENSQLIRLSNQSFYGFKGAELNIPEGITSIEFAAFWRSSLEYFIVPTTVTSLESQVFRDATSLKVVILNDSLTALEDEITFNNNTALTTVIYCGSSSTVQNYVYPNGVVPVCAKTAIYMKNGGVGTMAADTATVTSNLKANSFTKAGGYSFSGWNTKSDGSGTSYVNSAPYSFASNIVLYAQWTDNTIAGAPTIGSASSTGQTTASISFTAPASNGGSTITRYTATSSSGGITGTLDQAGSGTINISGLTANTTYTFTVTALNGIGTSNPSSASNSIRTGETAEQTQARIASEKAVAEKKRQAAIAAARTSLLAKIEKKENLTSNEISNTELPFISSKLQPQVNAALQALSPEAQKDFEKITQVVKKYEVFDKIQGNVPGTFTARDLVVYEIIPIGTPQPSFLVRELRNTAIEDRDTMAEIEAFVVAKTAVYNARKARLAALL